jgi:hypothetical protein
MKFTKYVLPVVVGSAVGMFIISMGEFGLQSVYHLPDGATVKDLEALKKALLLLPLQAFLLLLGVHFVGSFVSGVAATLVIKRVSIRPAVIVGVVLTFAGIANALMIPQPVWFSFANLLVYLPGALLGYLITRKKEVAGQ